MQQTQNFIGGAWCDASGGARSEVRNPADVEDVVASCPLSTAVDADRAVQAAARAAECWAETPGPERGAVLHRTAELIVQRQQGWAAAITREEGKTLAEARAEVGRAADLFRYFAGEGWRDGGAVIPGNGRASQELLYTRHEPLGVVVVVTPWNFPIAIPSWKIAPALAYGNAVVFKPAAQTPVISQMLVHALADAGLPPGVVNLVMGQGASVGDALVSNPGVHGVTFTGSFAVGQRVYEKAARNRARVQLELGGKNPLVVLADADLDLAVDLAVRGGFGLTGQACTASSRLIVEEPVAEEFSSRLGDAAAALRVGAGDQQDTQMGPVVSAAQKRSILELIATGRAEGARLVAGGGALDGAGHFLAPTVFDHVRPEMRIAREEIFGPVVGIQRAKDFAHALAQANASEFGLAAGIVTTNLARAMAFADRVDAGLVKINQPTTGLALQAPFGGFKASSANTFKEQGGAAVHFYTRVKTVYLGAGPF